MATGDDDLRPPSPFARLRELLGPIARRLGPPRSYRLTRSLLLRLLGVVYLFAFLGLFQQGLPLLGSHGLTPIASTLDRLREGGQGFVEVPTLFWLDAASAKARLRNQPRAGLPGAGLQALRSAWIVEIFDRESIVCERDMSHMSHAIQNLFKPHTRADHAGVGSAGPRAEQSEQHIRDLRWRHLKHHSIRVWKTRNCHEECFAFSRELEAPTDVSPVLQFFCYLLTQRKL